MPRRHVRRFLAPVAGALVACLLAACGGGSARPQVALPTGNSDLQSLFEAHGFVQLEPQIALPYLKALGVDRVRVYIAWSTLAPDPTSRHPPAGFDAADPRAYSPALWAAYDAIVREAAKVHIGIDVTVGSPPPLWAASPGAPAHSVHASSWEPSAQDFGAFMHALGERYSGHYRPAGAARPLPRVDFWSIWNEPNYGPYLAPQAIDHSQVEVAPRYYRALVDAAWASLAATGHTAFTDTILIGETAPRAPSQQPGNFNGTVPLRFVRALYCVDSTFKPLTGAAATVRGCPATAAASKRFAAANPALFAASGFAVHPYSDTLAPNVLTPAPLGEGYADFAALGNLESTLDNAAGAYGRDPKLPIYSTEYGYWTNPPTAYGIPLATAAAYMNESEYLSWRNPRIRTFDQYLLTDPPAGSGSRFDTGIEFANGIPKPYVFDAYRMPLWLPRTTGTPRKPLVVWGCVRPAPVVAARTHHSQRVLIQFKAAGGGRFTTVSRLTLPIRTSCYFVTGVRFSGSGVVRLAWHHSDQTLYSRTQAITL
jgi:hypothetical protein